MTLDCCWSSSGHAEVATPPQRAGRVASCGVCSCSDGNVPGMSQLSVYHERQCITLREFV